MKSARQTAFEILNKIQRDESYSNLVLDSALDKAEIDIKDKRFVSALVYGVTERRITVALSFTAAEKTQAAGFDCAQARRISDFVYGQNS